ncbi:chemotaxis protein CheA [Grimontia sp. NTOU-MAR1]|uniref:chemotaxis protein CheA n=1 Tax=Grimontia sp. NTOU-MAR1 TaxID=3111011 RepID=UPI002DB6012A|nr:chemotaxis protein CheW [Grimontia sp. NTOU-MAR1]WRW00591.1 chemotaxis protein CheW [Grimontia sp. NTOU-MAR1]
MKRETSKTTHLKSLAEKAGHIQALLGEKSSLSKVNEEIGDLLTFHEDHQEKDMTSYRAVDDLLINIQAFTDYLAAGSSEPDEQSRELLMRAIEEVQEDLRSFINDQPNEEYSDHKEAFLAGMATCFLNRESFDIRFCEDTFAFDGDVADELAYLCSLVEHEGQENSPKLVSGRKFLSKTKTPQTSSVQSNFEQTTRVKSQLLEKLMSHTEELVQIRNMMVDLAEQEENQRLTELSNKLMTISDNMLGDLLKTRMRPMGNLLSKYRRMVRDLSNELGKKVDVDIIGENIELDNNVLDAINEPLTHLVRNAIDHGFEMPDERNGVGKPLIGRLLIHAYNESGKVVINIEDDGKGIDTEKVLNKAINTGVISSEQAARMSDKEIMELIFYSGLSTSEQVSSVSGRGVGMDAVKRKVEEIKGTVDIYSKIGVGTEISLMFPLTMATLRVALFQVGGLNYAIPSSEISGIVGVSRIDDEISIRFESGSATMLRKGKVTPLIEARDYLGELVNGESFQSLYEQGKSLSVVTFKDRGQYWGLVVDEVRAFLDIVIKPLDKSMNHGNIFSGATLLGNGDLALVINLKRVLRFVRYE